MSLQEPHTDVSLVMKENLKLQETHRHSSLQNLKLYKLLNLHAQSTHHSSVCNISHCIHSVICRL